MLDLNGIDVRDWLKWDATDIPRLFAQDEAIACRYTDGFTVSAAPRSDERLATEFVALREARKLPFCDGFHAFIEEALLEAQEEISIRLLAEPGRWRTLPKMVE